jgi:hypothetical protein
MLEWMDGPVKPRRFEDIIGERNPDTLPYEGLIEGKTCGAMPQVAGRNK